MAFQGVISDFIDPATLRPDLPLVIATGSRFIPIDLPDFSPKINLPPHIKPDNAWGLFILYFF